MKIPSVYLKTFSLVLSVGLIIGESLIATASINPTSPSQSQQTSSPNLLAKGQSSHLKGLRFRVKGVRATQRRTGGFARGAIVEGTCNDQPMKAIALLPQNNRASLQQNEIEVEKTVSLNPTFLVYLSETQSRQAEFVVLNEAGDQVVYSQDIPLTGDAGMLSLSVPKSSDPNQSLQVGQKYHWSFTVRCDTSADAQGDLQVDGWVEVVSKEGALAGVDNMSEEQRLQVYAENNIWTDLVSSLAQLHETNPTAWEEDWKSVLESVGLADVIGDDSTSASVPQ